MRLTPLFALLPALVLAQTAAFALQATAGQAPASAGKPATATAAPKPAAPAQGAGPAKPAAGTPARPATAGAAAAGRPAGAGAAQGANPATMTDDQKTIYALGLLVQRSLRNFDFSAAELALVQRAMVDAAAGKPAVDIAEWGPKIQGFAQGRGQQALAKEKTASAAYVTTAAAGAGATKLESGIVYTELTGGTGASPATSDVVRVHYKGTLRDGTEFDSSYARNEPAEFPLNRVIPCWTQGVAKMKVGGKARLVCPSDLAYGDQGNQDIPGGSALVFDVELLGIVTPPAAGPAAPAAPGVPGVPATPAAPAAPPAPGSPNPGN